MPPNPPDPRQGGEGVLEERREGKRPNQEQIKNIKKIGMDCDNSFRKSDGQKEAEHCVKRSRQELCKLISSKYKKSVGLLLESDNC